MFLPNFMLVSPSEQLKLLAATLRRPGLLKLPHGHRVRFFKKIQDWILISEKIGKRILRFFTNQINPISLGSWCFKGTEESTLKMDSSVPTLEW